MSSPWKNPILLHRLYNEEGMTTQEIADKLGCADRTVRTWMDKLDIDRRPRGRRPGWESDKPAMHTLENDDGYEVAECFDPVRDDDGELVDTIRRVVQIHRLVAVAEYGYDQVMKDGIEVHHRDGMKLHNAPRNLVPLHRKRHAALDWDRRWSQEWVGDYGKGDEGPDS